MASVSYQYAAAQVQNPHLLLTNSKNDYLLLGSPNHSNYDGFFLRDGNSYYKIAYNIEPAAELKQVEVRRTITRRYADASQEFALLDEGMLMQGRGRFTLVLDCKHL